MGSVIFTRNLDYSDERFYLLRLYIVFVIYIYKKDNASMLMTAFIEETKKTLVTTLTKKMGPSIQFSEVNETLCACGKVLQLCEKVAGV